MEVRQEESTRQNSVQKQTFNQQQDFNRNGDVQSENQQGGLGQEQPPQGQSRPQGQAQQAQQSQGQLDQQQSQQPPGPMRQNYDAQQSAQQGQNQSNQVSQNDPNRAQDQSRSQTPSQQPQDQTEYQNQESLDQVRSNGEGNSRNDESDGQRGPDNGSNGGIRDQHDQDGSGSRDNDSSASNDHSRGNDASRYDDDNPRDNDNRNGGGDNDRVDRDNAQSQSNIEDYHRNDYGNSGGLEGGSKAGIIAGSVAAAILILVALTYVFWRRRRGASYSEIARFRKHTPSVPLEEEGGEGGVTALPVYRNHHHASKASQPDVLMDISALPPMAETSHRGSVVEANLWKSANPPCLAPGVRPLVDSSQTPISASLSSISSGPRTRQHDRAQPPRYQLRKSDTGHGLVRQKTDGTTSDEEDKLEAPISPQGSQGGRWSWTNSQAPSTPRVGVPNARSSLTSFTSCVMLRQDQEKGENGIATAKSLPILKNHPVRPIRVPPPIVRKMSKKMRAHRRGGSLSIKFKPGASESTSPRPPLSPRLEEGPRTSTSTAAISPVAETFPQHR